MENSIDQAQLIQAGSQETANQNNYSVEDIDYEAQIV